MKVDKIFCDNCQKEIEKNQNFYYKMPGNSETWRASTHDCSDEDFCSLECMSEWLITNELKKLGIET